MVKDISTEWKHCCRYWKANVLGVFLSLSLFLGCDFEVRKHLVAGDEITIHTSIAFAVPQSKFNLVEMNSVEFASAIHMEMHRNILNYFILIFHIIQFDLDIHWNEKRGNKISFNAKQFSLALNGDVMMSQKSLSCHILSLTKRKTIQLKWRHRQPNAFYITYSEVNSIRSLMPSIISVCTVFLLDEIFMSLQRGHKPPIQECVHRCRERIRWRRPMFPFQLFRISIRRFLIS